MQTEKFIINSMPLVALENRIAVSQNLHRSLAGKRWKKKKEVNIHVHTYKIHCNVAFGALTHAAGQPLVPDCSLQCVRGVLTPLRFPSLPHTPALKFSVFSAHPRSFSLSLSLLFSHSLVRIQVKKINYSRTHLVVP